MHKKINQIKRFNHIRCAWIEIDKGYYHLVWNSLNLGYSPGYKWQQKVKDDWNENFYFSSTFAAKSKSLSVYNTYQWLIKLSSKQWMT